ncbi:MAG TPA: type II toxin-antitoxin system prevent-host-death family antitoxin [Gemmataceae bacterium]|jgi:prevent-host-death family protein
MTTIGFYEARTHFSQLLDEVARGKKVLITRHGKPAALLTPPPPETETDVREVIRRMKEFRRQHGPVLGPGLTIRDLIEEGRRF